MKITELIRHYIYIPYKPPVDPYWGWKAPCHGAHAVIIEMKTDEGVTGWGETAGREALARHGDAAEMIIGWQYIFGILIYFIITGIYYTIIFYRKFREKELNEAHMQLLTRDAQLKALKMQINPHFLFNSLNSINALVTTDPKLARKMIELLSDLFRISLYHREKIFLPVKQELSFAHKYLEIESIRFSDRLSVTEDIDESLTDALFPALTLQPLLENAVKHGIAKSRGNSTISIILQSTPDKMITCTISNTVDLNSPVQMEKIGTGLENIRRRLRLLYGENHEFTAELAHGNIFIVTFRIPEKYDDQGNNNR